MNNGIRALTTGVCLGALVLVGSGSGNTTARAAGKHFHIDIVTKAETIAVFQDVDTGASVAAKDLGDTFSHTGPSTPDATKQHDLIVNTLIPTHPDAIGVSANDPQVVGGALAQAKARGIKTFSWDSDVTPSARSVFVNQAPVDKVGKLLAKMACQDVAGCSGQIAILSATTASTNQNSWIAAMKKHLSPKLKLVKIAYGNDDPSKSTTETEGLLSAFPSLKAIVAPTSVGIVAASRVVQTRHLTGKVDVTGLCFAKEMSSYLKSGVSKECALWSFKDLGYLAFQVGHALAAGTITGKAGQTFSAGKLGKYTIKAGGEVILGPLQVYTKSNVGNYIVHASKCCG